MKKQTHLSAVPVGKTFEVWGRKFTVLKQEQGKTFVLAAEVETDMEFRLDDSDFSVAANDFRDSSIKDYLNMGYLDDLENAGADRDSYILPLEIDLKCTLGQHEYGTDTVKAGLLTLEQYGEYYDIIPPVDSPWWLATPWKTPSRSPYTYNTYRVWHVLSNGDCNVWHYGSTYGVRPALTLSPSLLVSVECDEEEEVESKWHEYLEYLIHWAISHSDKGFAGCMPACYNEWLDSEGSDEE